MTLDEADEAQAHKVANFSRSGNGASFPPPKMRFSFSRLARWSASHHTARRSSHSAFACPAHLTCLFTRTCLPSLVHRSTHESFSCSKTFSRLRHFSAAPMASSQRHHNTARPSSMHSWRLMHFLPWRHFFALHAIHWLVATPWRGTIHPSPPRHSSPASTLPPRRLTCRVWLT